MESDVGACVVMQLLIQMLEEMSLEKRSTKKDGSESRFYTPLSPSLFHQPLVSKPPGAPKTPGIQGEYLSDFILFT